MSGNNVVVMTESAAPSLIFNKYQNLFNVTVVSVATWPTL